MKRVALTILSVLAIGGCFYQQPKSACNECPRLNEKTDCLEYLKSSKCFRVGGVGFAGAIAPEEIALRRLMRQDNAFELLKRLSDKGSSVGKLYALLGLRYVDRGIFNELAIDLRNRNDVVETQEGCIIFEASMCDLVESIEDGVFDMYME